MLKKTLVGALYQPWRMVACRRRSSSATSSTVDSIILRSLKEHYIEVSKMTPPPKVNPPSPFTIMKGALDTNGPVLKRNYKDEEISITVARLENLMAGGGEEQDDEINQLFLNVEISKPGQKNCLELLCGLYPDALGIHSVAMRPKKENSRDIKDEDMFVYSGPEFGDLNERMRDAFHNYIEERGINEDLFPFLQAWLYVRDHRNLTRFFRSVGTFINDGKSSKDA